MLITLTFFWNQQIGILFPLLADCVVPLTGINQSSCGRSGKLAVCVCVRVCVHVSYGCFVQIMSHFFFIPRETVFV